MRNVKCGGRRDAQISIISADVIRPGPPSIPEEHQYIRFPTLQAGNVFERQRFITGTMLMERHMTGTPRPQDSPLRPGIPMPLPELPDLDPVPEDDNPDNRKEPRPEDVPYVPPPGTQ